jgi:membrane protein YdbS with pleckstrin-like domain
MSSRHTVHHRAATSPGGLIGILACGLTAAVVVGLVLAALRAGPSPRGVLLALTTVAAVALLCFLLWWSWGYFNLRYSLEPDALVIRWASNRYILPYSGLQKPRRGGPAQSPRGIRWPGYFVGRVGGGAAPADGEPVFSLATRPAPEQVLVGTPVGGFAISPADPTTFIGDLETRRKLAAGGAIAPRIERRGLTGLALWSDALAMRALVVGLLLNLLAFAWIAWQYPALPEQVALRYRYDPGFGLTLPGSPQPADTVWRLPMLSLALLLLNAAVAALIHKRVRMGANLLLIGSAIVQAGLVLILTRLG